VAVPRVADEGILCTLAALTRDCSLLQMAAAAIRHLHAGRRCGSLDACPLAYSVRLECTHHSWLQLMHCAACKKDSKQALLLPGSLAARKVKLSLQLRECNVADVQALVLMAKHAFHLPTLCAQPQRLAPKYALCLLSLCGTS
jgi:hypothetical protein